MGFISHFLVFLPTWWLSLQTPGVAFEFEFISRAALNPHIPRCSVVDNAALESWGRRCTAGNVQAWHMP